MRLRRAVVAITAAATCAAFLPIAGLSPNAGAVTYDSLNQIQKRLLSGLASLELGPQAQRRGSSAPDSPSSAAAARGLDLRNYQPGATGDCGFERGDNVKVNQNCVNLTDLDLHGRGQAQNEAFIAVDPFNPQHIVASSNDYRRGDGNCWTEHSVDGGQTWNDAEAPMSFTRGAPAFNAARQYWQAGGDTSLAWDTRGNAYLSCQVFNRGLAASSNKDESSALLVFRSTQNAGASFNFPGRQVVVINDLKGSGAALLDKQLLAVDNHVSSPFRDRVYVSWTNFAADGTGYINLAYSSDFGETWSKPRIVSGDSNRCQETFGLPTPNGRCNENQDSQPFVGPDGTLYVVYNNYNNRLSGQENYNHVLLVRSTDGGDTFTSPVLAGRVYDLPDCATYQDGNDPGRSCIPEKGSTTNSIFRANNYPSASANPTDPAQIAVTYGSYVNRYSNEKNGCVPQGFSDFGLPRYDGVKKVGACNNGIVISVSNDGGKTFTGTTTSVRDLPVVTNDPGQRKTDQWFQWADFAPSGRLAVAYYDRQYGDDEMTGWSAFSLSTSTGVTGFASQRLTTSSMPPPTQFEGVFWGDYTGLSAADGKAHPIWSDTRDPAPLSCGSPGSAGPQICVITDGNGITRNDQNSYTTTRSIP